MLLANCSKKPENQLESVLKKGSGHHFTRHAGPELTFDNFGTDIVESDFLGHPMDDSDAAFDQISYAMTLGLLRMYRDEAMTDALVAAINGAPTKRLKLFTFADNNSGVDAIMDSVFKVRLDDFATGDNWRDYVNQHYKYDVSYEPIVFFANPGDYDVTEQPYLAGPFEFDEEDFPEFNNTIPLWAKDSTGAIRFSAIDEPAANMTMNPLIILGGAVPGEEPGDDIRPGAGGGGGGSAFRCSISTHTHEQLRYTQFKINNSYEQGSNKSEYTFIAVTTAVYVPDQNGGGSWNYYIGDHNRIAFAREVSNDELGTWISFDHEVFSPGTYSTNSSNFCFDIASLSTYTSFQNRFCVGAFEYDWYAEMHKLGSIMSGPTTSEHRTNFEGRRKYLNEVYFFDDIDANGYYMFPQWNPLSNPTFTQTRPFGEVKLVRSSY